MAWRERMQAASFRGVPFEVLRDSQPAGQRVEVHEYPQRDKPLVEPLGRRTNEITIQAFVAGDDCLDQRDALLAAINEPGSGELIHPWLGSLTVSVTDCTYTHERAAMGVVRFDITFVEGEAEPDYPAASRSAAAALGEAADAMEASAIDRFVAALAGLDPSALRLDAVAGAVDQITGIMRDVYGGLDTVLGSAFSVVDSILSAPAGFARSVFDAVRATIAPFTSFYARVSGSPSLPSMSARLAAVRRIGATENPPSPAARQLASAARDLMQDVMCVDVVRAAAALPARPQPQPQPGTVGVDVLPPSAAVEFSDAAGVLSDVLASSDAPAPVADDVLALRDALHEQFWGVAAAADPRHYERMTTARIATERHLVSVARQGDVLTTLQNPTVAPALVLAYRRYGDATRAADIVARNRVRHPGFVPAQSLQVPRV